MRSDVDSWGLTDIGLVRTNNEDVWVKLDEHNVFILADGMGGHRAGEVAAKEAVDALRRIVEQKLTEKPSAEWNESGIKDMLYNALVDVNSIVYSIGSSDESLRGMGTTLCCLLIAGDRVIYGHIGDSRIYRLRNGSLTQLTHDHTLRTPHISEDDESVSGIIKYKNFLTRTVGNDPLTFPDIDAKEIQNSDTFLLCSDGLTDMVPPEDIQRIMNTAPSVKECAQNLVSLAKANGGVDNVTVIVVKMNQLEA